MLLPEARNGDNFSDSLKTLGQTAGRQGLLWLAKNVSLRLSI